MLDEIFAAQNWFLIAVAVVWAVGAIVQDFRKREVANWWNFSLIIIALAYRGFLSVAEKNYWYALWGLIGLACGFVLANAFYYARLFAGGDAKFMMGFGAILPLGMAWQTNLRILVLFLFLFIVLGGIYGAIYSLFVAVLYKKQFAAEFSRQMKKYGKWILPLTALFVLAGFASFFFSFWMGVWLAVLFAVSPWLLLYAKTIEESCMIRLVKTKELAVGDWLASAVKVGKQQIKPDWQGLSELQVELLQRGYHKKVQVRYGVPFTPTFLLAFTGMLAVLWFGWGIEILETLVGG